MRARLTDAFIRDFPTPAALTFIWDTNPNSPRRFGVWVTPNGVRSFMIVYRVRAKGGKERKLRLGLAGPQGLFADLEDQMTAFAPDFDRSRAGFSPDRVDALVWALTELVLGQSCQGWLDWAKHTAENIRAGRPMHSSPPTPDRVTLRAPRPHMLFAPAKGVRYVADEDGIIRDIDPDHVKALHAVGCTDDLSGAPLMDVLRSPAPHHTFMPRTGTTYTSDGNCIIRNVAPEDRGLLLMAGCTAITDDTEEH